MVEDDAWFELGGGDRRLHPDPARSANSISRQGDDAQVTPARGSACPPAADRRWMEWRRFMALSRRALAGGATRDGPVITWRLDAASKWPCARPLELRAWRSARKSAVFDERKPATPQAMLVLWGRCRRCPGCLEQRRRLWIARTLREAQACPGRAWFVTLTSGPEHREWLERKAQLLAWRSGAEFSRDPFRWRALAWRPELSLYLKRVRKGVGRLHRPRLRFLAVVEPHKDEVAHAHLLVFEHSPDAPVSERLLTGRWAPRGHCVAKLCSASAAAYVSKYLAKDQRASVQASCRFGQVETISPISHRRGERSSSPC
jgi:hypothetical protein